MTQTEFKRASDALKFRPDLKSFVLCECRAVYSKRLQKCPHCQRLPMEAPK